MQDHQSISIFWSSCFDSVWILQYCSMLNWMLYFRGNSKDFEEWEKLGNPGWGWRDVLPFFKKAERFAGANEDGVYGTDGNFKVMIIPHLYKACKERAECILKLTKHYLLNFVVGSGCAYCSFSKTWPAYC